MHTSLISLFIISIISIISIIGYYTSLPGKLTPSSFISNTYLYVALAISIACFTVLKLSERGYTLTSTHLVILFIISMISMVGVSSFNNNALRHITWLSFVVAIGFLTYPIYRMSEGKEESNKIIVTTIILTIGLSLFSKFSSFDFLSWRSYLVFALFSLIVLESLDLIFHKSESGLNNRFKLYSYASIVLFSGFILYDTKSLARRSLVVEKRNVNYPKESLSLFLDIINLFAGVSNASR
jgi:FtsH-binding integral membrane protein